MTETKSETLAQALATRFSAAMVGDGGVTYWYTPSVVVRVPGFSELCLDESQTSVILCIVPEAPETVGGLGFTTMRAELLIHIAAAVKYDTAQASVLTPPAVHREVLQNRMLQDIERAVGTSNTLGSLCLWARVVEREKSASRTYVDGWAVAYASVLIEYAYTEGAP